MAITKIRGTQIKDLTLLNQHIDTTAGIEYTKLEHVPLASDGFNSPSSDIDWGNYKLTNLAAPINGTDAARKSYVDNLVTGLFWKGPARFIIDYVKTTSGAPSGTGLNLEVCINTTDDKLYSNDGTSWVELSLVDGDIFVFAKDGSDTSGNSGTYLHDNKVYKWESSAWTDTDPATNEARLIRQASINVDEDTGWTYNDDGTTWVQFTGAGQIVAGPGLAKSGNQMYIPNDGVKDSMIDWGNGAEQVSLDDVPDGTSYERVAANQLSSGIYIDATTAVKGIASFNTNHFSVSSGAVSIGTDSIDDTLIDWGTGANQVNATDIPLTSAVQGQNDVQAALTALESQTTNLDIFKTVSVSGQDDIVANGNTSTLTFAAGNDMSITTDSTSGVVTFTVTGADNLTASLGVERVGDDFRLDILANGGIALTGNEVRVEAADIIDTTKGLEIISDDIAVNVDELSGLAIDSTAGIQVNLDSGDALEFNAGAIRIKADGIKDTHIDWGTGAGQVNATDIPLTSAVQGQNDVQAALTALETQTGNLGIFKTVSVSGQDDVVADSNTDTITFIAGTDITISTDSTSDSITISSSGSSSLTASLGVERVGNDFRADLVTDGGIRLNGNELEIDLDANELMYNDGTSVVGHKFIVRETPSGTINGVNVTFTLANTPASDTEQIFLNGVLQEAGGEDYTISGNTITMVDAPISGDRIKVSYISA